MSAEVVQFPRRVPPPSPEPWLTKRQIADHLSVSASWIERRMRHGLPHHRDPVKRWVVRFRASEVDAWMEGR
jgi:predicted DNA-binding transcriptional regulator AlpA